MGIFSCRQQTLVFHRDSPPLLYGHSLDRGGGVGDDKREPSNGRLKKWDGIHSGSVLGLRLGFWNLLRGVSQVMCAGLSHVKIAFNWLGRCSH